MFNATLRGDDYGCMSQSFGVIGAIGHVVGLVSYRDV